MNTYDKGLMWFRRDLRTEDNAALYHALKACRQVWCVFVFDTDILDALLERGLRADRRVEFIHRSLAELDTRLRALGRAAGAEGVGMIIQHARAREAIPKLAQSLGVRLCLPTTTTNPQPMPAMPMCWALWPIRASCSMATKTMLCLNAGRC